MFIHLRDESGDSASEYGRPYLRAPYFARIGKHGKEMKADRFCSRLKKAVKTFGFFLFNLKVLSYLRSLALGVRKYAFGSRTKIPPQNPSARVCRAADKPPLVFCGLAESITP